MQEASTSTADPVRAALTDLARDQVGLEWIHTQLVRAKDAYGLDDLVLVIDESKFDRQVFRAGQRPFRGGWATHVARHGPAGLYGLPETPLAQEDRDAFVCLCALVLELDTTRRLARRDPLTGLPNRRAFDEELSRATETARRYGWEVTLVLIDLDDFKRLNDEQGHAAGDAVLRRLGRALSAVLRQGDVAARIGGDEFALLLQETNGEAISEVIDRVRNELTDGGTPVVSFSVGAASCPREATEPGELAELADLRLYEDKQAAAP